MFPISDVIPSRTAPVVTVAIIVVNAFVFLYQLTLPEPALQLFVARYAVVPAYFYPATLVTSQFLHGGFLHVGGNMLYLWIFGDNVEDRLGHARFLVFYLVRRHRRGDRCRSSSIRSRRSRCSAPAARSPA